MRARFWLLATALPMAAQAQPADPAVTVLLAQAFYWRDHGRPAQAEESLRRVLLLDPANPQALAQLAQDARPVPTALTRARALAQAGKAAEAASAYQSLFEADAPPASLATEYYQTLAATPDGQAAAEAGLAAVLHSHPEDLPAQLAYARLLVQRQDSRAAGIERLASLAGYRELAQPAREAWRTALLASAANPRELDALGVYLQRYPGDTEVADRRRAIVEAQRDAAAGWRNAGYQAVQDGREPDAERAFNAALAQDPNDADALAMLSILQREQGHTAAAEQLLDRAVAVAPARRDELIETTRASFPGPQSPRATAELEPSRSDSGDALADLHATRHLQAAPPPGHGSGALDDRLRHLRYASYQPGDKSSDAPLLPPAVPGESVTRQYERDAQTAPSSLAARDSALGALINPPSVPVPTGTRPVLKVQNGAPAHPPTGAKADEINTLPTLQSVRRPQPPADPVMAEIDRRVNQASAPLAIDTTVSLGLRVRSGPNGLASLDDFSAPLEASLSPNGFGQLKLSVTPEILQAGTGHSAEFGTAPLAGAARGGQSSATGVGLALGYSDQFVSADAGTTPLGFQLTNFVGGVELAPEFSPRLILRATLDRRAVTDSLLSYAGERDPRTGESFGGVVRDHAHLQIEGTVNRLSYYLGGGAGLLTGENVRSNSETDAGAGFSVTAWSLGSQEVRTGLDLVYASYNRNLQGFTFGSGGYFSPSNFIAGLIPVSYRQTISPDLKFSVGGSIGVQSYTERGAPVFQAFELQRALLAVAAVRPGTPTTLPGTQTSSLAGGAHADIDYRVLANLHLGAKAGFDRSGNFTEGTGLVYARYLFGGGGDD